MSTEDPAVIRQEIEATRAELGETIEALAEKTDVTAHARRKLDETRASLSEKRGEVVGKVRGATPESAAAATTRASTAAKQKPIPIAAIGAFLAGFLTGRLSRR